MSRPPRPLLSLSWPRLLGLTLVLGGVGIGLGVGWATLLRRAVESSGAPGVASAPGTLTLDLVGLAVVTAGLGGAAVLLRGGLRRLVGHAAGPLWTTVGALLIGENLALALRLITLATLTMRDAVELSAVTGAPPTVDLAAAPLAPWAAAGVLSGMVLVGGLMIVLAQLREPDAA